MRILQTGFELNDLLLVSKYSTVISRNDVDLSTDFGNGFVLKIPIMASPMSGIVGVNLIKKLGRLGGIGILHRFYTDKIKRKVELAMLEISNIHFGVAVGLNDEFYQEAINSGTDIICIDVANGYLDSVLKFVNEVYNYISRNDFNCLVMAGNVCTLEGASHLATYGANIIRVGIGSGGLCTTRKNTGIGIPQATAISGCQGDNEICQWYTVADGGIRNSGDAVKALALGADFVMMGSLFANCFESDNNGIIRGMASREFQEQFYGEVKKSVEGIQKRIDKTMHLYKFIDEFVWNMKSAFTYLDSKNIEELHKNAEFVTTGKDSIR